jgi:hypothetical protein
MKYRIAIWATAGFLVAAFWAIYAFATFPDTNERMRNVWALITVTCPVAIAGKHFPLSMYLVFVANAATYALAGVIVEAARRQLHHAK